MAATMSAISSKAALTRGLAGQRAAQPARGRAAFVVRAQDPVKGRTVVDGQTEPNPAVVSGDVISYAKSLPGVTPPFPNVFDPANLLQWAGSSNAAIRDLRRWREAEVTHGRVAMLAALGTIVQEQIQDVPSRFFPHVRGPAIYHFQQVESQGAIFWLPLLLAIGIAEAYRVSIGWAFPKSENFYALRDDYEPGNLGFDPLGLLPDDPKDRKDMQSREINNGRLAMIAIIAFWVQELITGKEIFTHTAEKLQGQI